ncbi:biopolymer transporter ExbD [Sutterella massiliensis]|uniref:Biopolymer transporter ExbD n=1 Tax=Sutterella massiliensis TaxID=1816689 RepID=A0ABS2DS59_9BURK|nr:biopolymer transporter ExbD [Sutterella massiliensis]MBM6703977.1 biopolymer transporter ExbD [Sutterella massiliensis]
MDTNLFGSFEDEPQIDLTPLIDCLFMLIIFFVLTMSFSKPVLEVILPEATNAETSQARNELLVSVKADGTLYLNAAPATIEEIARALDEAPERLLNIYMDEEAPFSRFVAVMDLAKTKRNGRFVISTRRPESPESASPSRAASS